jgi:hypothetical protein
MEKYFKKLIRGVQWALMFATAVFFLAWFGGNVSGWYWFWTAVCFFILSEF